MLLGWFEESEVKCRRWRGRGENASGLGRLHFSLAGLLKKPRLALPRSLARSPNQPIQSSPVQNHVSRQGRRTLPSPNTTGRQNTQNQKTTWNSRGPTPPPPSPSHPPSPPSSPAPSTTIPALLALRPPLLEQPLHGAALQLLVAPALPALRGRELLHAVGADEARGRVRRRVAW